MTNGDTMRDLATCGTCGRTWDDSISTSWTPVPSGRCPFEYFHGEDETVPAALRQFISTIEATGGIELDDDGYMVPVGDPAWIDLADAYMAACDALNLGYAVNRTEER